MGSRGIQNYESKKALPNQNFLLLYVRTKPGSSIYLENKKKISTLKNTKNNLLFTKV